MKEKFPYYNKMQIINSLKSRNGAIRNSLGQNFLIDPNYVRKIIEIIKTYIPENQKILEIGPGFGVLTYHLQEKYFIDCVEIDPIICNILNENIINKKKTNLYNLDILKYIEEIGNEFYRYVIGNIPYYITTEIIIQISRKRPDFSFFLIQKEYADKLKSLNNSISIFIHNLASVRSFFKIPEKAFFPVPKVKSSFILVEYKKNPESPVKILEKILRMSFRSKRKKIINSWSNGEQVLNYKDMVYIANRVHFDYNKRAEEIPYYKFYELANEFSRYFDD